MDTDTFSQPDDDTPVLARHRSMIDSERSHLLWRELMYRMNGYAAAGLIVDLALLESTAKPDGGEIDDEIRVGAREALMLILRDDDGRALQDLLSVRGDSVAALQKALVYCRVCLQEMVAAENDGDDFNAGA